MHRFWRWIGRGADLGSLIGFALAVPAVIGLATGLVWQIYRSPGQALRAGLVSYAVLQIGLAAVAVVARRRAGRTLDLDIHPTGGPSPDVRLVVTNRGKPDEFHVQATIVACRNHGNVHKQGSYAIPWLGIQTDRLRLVRLESHALLVARFNTYDVPFRVGEVQLIELAGAKEQIWDWFRWVREPGAALPEFDLDLSFRSLTKPIPLELRYTIRPSQWSGPVELFARP
jgi:hypothetical protein